MISLVLDTSWAYCVHRFHVNSGVDGSSLSSPLESPDVPITSSVATLQSAESMSIRRQVRLSEQLSFGPSGGYSGGGEGNKMLMGMGIGVGVMAKSLVVPAARRPASLSVPTPDTPSARVSPHSSPPSSPDTVLSNPDDVDLLSFYDEFWEMTYFEHDLRCISIHNLRDPDDPHDPHDKEDYDAFSPPVTRRTS